MRKNNLMTIVAAGLIVVILFYFMKDSGSRQCCKGPHEVATSMDVVDEYPEWDGYEQEMEFGYGEEELEDEGDQD